jgi:hypothetical protein
VARVLVLVLVGLSIVAASITALEILTLPTAGDNRAHANALGAFWLGPEIDEQRNAYAIAGALLVVALLGSAAVIQIRRSP